MIEIGGTCTFTYQATIWGGDDYATKQYDGHKVKVLDYFGLDQWKVRAGDNFHFVAATEELT